VNPISVMAKGAYYFPLFYQRFLASCSGWKDDEVGAYIRLLIYQFDKGSIPNDMKILSRIGTSVKKNWHLLSTKFIIQNDGTLINEVMADIRLKYIDKQEINTENGSKGGRPKKNQTVIVGETESKPNHNPSESESKGIPITNNQYPNKEIYKENFSSWNWDAEKRRFLEDTDWMSKTYTQLLLKIPDLKWLMEFFTNELELKEDYKPQKEIKKHFISWFRKTSPNIKELRKIKIQNESSAPTESVREKYDRLNRESAVQ